MFESQTTHTRTHTHTQAHTHTHIPTHTHTHLVHRWFHSHSHHLGSGICHCGHSTSLVTRVPTQMSEQKLSWDDQK